MKTSEPDELPWPTEMARGFVIQRRVLAALVIRQLVAKYGRTNIGFLWIVLEPMILCGGVLVLRSMISGGEENGVPLIALLWSGYMPLTLWRHVSTAGVFALRRSSNLLYHRDVSLFDICMSTCINELGGCTLAALIVYYVLFIFGLIEPVHDMGLLLCGWMMMWILAMGMMAFFAVFTEMWEPAERFVAPFQYLILPLCGFFFMVDWLPESIQTYAMMMPTVDCYEMIRDGLFGPNQVTHYWAWYPPLLAIGGMAITLPLFEKARDKIHFG